MHEMARVRLRGLVRLIDPAPRAIIYTDFADTAGESTEIEIRRVAVGVDRARFRDKALAFLSDHEDDAVLFKVRHGKQLTALDLEQLEAIMIASGLDKANLTSAAPDGLGLFVRSLIGLDREAATEALSTFTAGTTFTASQLDFVNLLVEQLTQRGVVGPELLFEAPFTSVSSTSPVTLFGDSKVSELLAALKCIRGTAEAG